MGGSDDSAVLLVRISSNFRSALNLRTDIWGERELGVMTRLDPVVCLQKRITTEHVIITEGITARTSGVVTRTNKMENGGEEEREREREKDVRHRQGFCSASSSDLPKTLFGRRAPGFGTRVYRPILSLSRSLVLLYPEALDAEPTITHAKQKAFSTRRNAS